MGAPEAIKATASQPVGEATSLRFSVDYKKYQALMNASYMVRGAYESVEAYQERMAKFRLELAKQIREENTTIAENRYRDIQDLALFKSNDPFVLRQGQSEIESLLRFTYFNNTNPLDLTGLRAQQLNVETRLASLKRGLEPEYNSEPSSGGTLYSGEFQGVGQRDFFA